MDWVQTIITLITVLIGSGLIQFFFTRKDKKTEDEKINHDDKIKKELKDHLDNVNSKWKIDYCDKNAEAINKLIGEVREGLSEREKTGRLRYEEHKLAIEQMNLEHQKDFQALKEAIDKLTEHDSKITDSLQKMSSKQDVVADGMVGIAHDRIVFVADKIIRRGAVTMKEKATLESIYAPYVKLGGNSYAKKSMEHVDKLPVITEEEALKLDEQKA